MDQSIIQDYQKRIEFARQQIVQADKLVNQYSIIRLVLFIALLLSIYISVKIESTVLFIGVLIILGAAFNYLVKKQSSLERDKSYYQSYEAINQNELNSLNNRSNIYPKGDLFEDDKHPYTGDLDIFGQASIYQLINRASTFCGQQLLASWLTAPASAVVIQQRQQAVKELAAKNDVKLKLQAHLLFALKADREQITRMLTYLNMPVNLGNASVLSMYVNAAPFLILASLVSIPFLPAAGYLTVALLILNNRLVASKSKEVEKADLIAGKIGESLNSYANAFEALEHEVWQSELCKKLSEDIKQTGEPVSLRIRQLGRLINNLNQRLSMIVSAILNALLAWDIRQVLAIESWKQNNHQNLKLAFEAVAEFETLYSLASLHINYPDWCFPAIATGEGYTLTASAIAHPLINRGQRVSNDYELNDTYKIDIITGSNMAGKSTFLRTLGINTVLALSGAPVCAESMQVSVINLVTYMRIKDNLNESTSTFKAELDRLQMLLKAVDEREKVFFLIDEMLRGTNSADKYLGSKAIIERLISKKGVGLVATHDLQIAELEQTYPDYIRNFYFDIEVKDGEMLFDYKIKPGECKTFNASMLLRRLGIEV